MKPCRGDVVLSAIPRFEPAHSQTPTRTGGSGGPAKLGVATNYRGNDQQHHGEGWSLEQSRGAVRHSNGQAIGPVDDPTIMSDNPATIHPSEIARALSSYFRPAPTFTVTPPGATVNRSTPNLNPNHSFTTTS